MEHRQPKGKQTKRIAINTGGGDAPGLNAVIRAVVVSAHELGWEVFGIKRGYAGLIDKKGIVKLTPESVTGVTNLGGSILGTASRGNPFEYPCKSEDGTLTTKDISDVVVENFHDMGFDVLIAVGGDGSLRIAYEFMKKGIPVIGVPKTIDNDLSETVITFGFDTAVSTATEAIDKMRSTAQAHERIMVVEVMGRYAGWIALNSGISAEAHVILIPEVPFDLDKVCDHLLRREKESHPWSIVVAAEGAHPKEGTMLTVADKEVGREIRLGGIGKYVADEIAKRMDKETRSLVLGHLQRGGHPTTFDRLIALRFGAAAVRLFAAGITGMMVALDPPTVKPVPIAAAIGRMKSVPLDCDTVITARSLGICFGD